MDIQVILNVALTILSTQAKTCLKNQHCSNCSSETQLCITNCFPGYFDLKCMSPCSQNCMNSNCSLTEEGVAKCSEGCAPGFRGSQCNHACTSPKGICTRCPQGCDGNYCHLASSCVSGCHDSYYGSNCKTCSRRCRHCNRKTGRCDVCYDPYSGLDCEYSSDNCSATNLVQPCAPGLYGLTCSKQCSKNCLADHTAHKNVPLTSNSSDSCISACQRSSGECINGCVDGWFGPNCSSQIQCDSNCMGCKEAGACVEECLPGYFGDDCKPCSRNCVNNTCHPKNGTCSSGCIQGQYGQFCNLSCINCPGGAESEETNVGTATVLVIGLSTACVLLIGGILVVLFRRCSNTSSSERDHESVRPESSRHEETLEYYALHRYWDIEDYDEVSEPLDQQQRPAEEENKRDPALPVLADYFPGALDTDANDSGPALPVLGDYFPGALDTEANDSGPALPVLADYFPGALDTEANDSGPALPVLADYFPGALNTEANDSGLALPVLADYFPVALNTEDNGGDTSCSSSSGSQSYTHLMRDNFADVPRTIITYISPTEDKT